MAAHHGSVRPNAIVGVFLVFWHGCVTCYPVTLRITALLRYRRNNYVTVTPVTQVTANIEQQQQHEIFIHTSTIFNTLVKGGLVIGPPCAIHSHAHTWGHSATAPYHSPNLRATMALRLCRHHVHYTAMHAHHTWGHSASAPSPH